MGPWLALVAAVALAGVLWLPWSAGGRAQDLYGRVVDALHRSGLPLVENRFRRGWTESRATSVFVLAGSGVAASDWRLETNTRVRHPLTAGSALVRSRTSLRLRGSHGDVWALPLALTARAETGGLTLWLEPVDLAPAGSAASALRVSGSRGRLTLDPADGRLRGELGIERLQIGTTGARRLELRGLELGTDSWQAAAGGRIGGAKLSIDVLELADEGAIAAIRVGGLQLELASTAEAGLLRLTLAVAWQTAALDGLKLDGGEFRLNLAGISVPTLVRLGRSLNRPAALGQGLQPDFFLLASALRYLPLLLRHGPRLTLERFRAQTVAGSVEARLTLAVQGMDAAQLVDRQSWLEALEADFAFRFPPALLQGPGWARDLKQPADRLLRNGLLRRDGALLATEGRLRAGLLSVNGKAFPLTLRSGAPD